MNQIQIAAKLYECRDACIRLWGEDWRKNIEFHTKLLKAFMNKYNIDNEIEAAIKLVNENKNADGSGIFTMKIFAAVIEMVDPIK